LGAAAARLRTEGLDETKPPEIQIKAMKGAWTESSAFNVVTNWLRLSTFQQARIDLIVAQNDAVAMGATKALQQFAADDSEKDRWRSIPLLGCDGLPKTGQAWVRSGILRATIITPPIAGQHGHADTRPAGTGSTGGPDDGDLALVPGFGVADQQICSGARTGRL
jgi:ABC-type sugar transport system substrate-binding protein